MWASAAVRLVAPPPRGILEEAAADGVARHANLDLSASQKMGHIRDSIATLNSVFRTVLLAVLIGGAGWAGYTGYSLYHEPQQKLAAKQRALQQTMRELEVARGDLAIQAAEITQLSDNLTIARQRADRLETALRLLKVDHRVARLRVLELNEGEGDDSPTALLEFVELNDDGAPIEEPRRFEVVGKQVYIEYLVVKFDDRYIEQSDLDRSTAICWFRRVWGDRQEPVAGFTPDEVGARPSAYARGGRMSEFEQQIWEDFWNIAHDPERAEQLGIRAAQATAVATEVRVGHVYQIELRSTGDFTLQPVREQSAG